MTSATATATRTRITNPKREPDNRAMKKVWILENLIFHPRTGAEERDAAERMLDRALAKAKETGQVRDTDNGAGVWHDYRLPEGSYGAKYEQIKRLSTTEIAKRIRADIKLARKVETKLGAETGSEIALPDPLAALATMPKTIKVSVRTDYYSGGSSIDVRVYNLPDKGWGFVEELDRYGQYKHWAPGPQLKPILDALKEIHWSYNYDRSDAMVDYFDRNYGGHVDVDWRERP
ncbi:hypothetical protein EDD90_2804 [Streptomyces sp. Ag109_O5-1]|uniref:hypothetical protein n=1 Tax=Streptomyces sp. Ag109_O5-1 TaxID=1938851 RepID=UPI000F4E28D0|nr:hypothetical protein [Streptomyces sp. Ag109_O5-1]RPE39786.1 hypothetical protein EDD90_2804 [Streptomyces sp. Ag109_O5-1]